MGPARASRETSVKGPVGLLRLDTRSLDHLGPLCGFVGDELAEIGGRARQHHAPPVGGPGPDSGLRPAPVGFPVAALPDPPAPIPPPPHAPPPPRPLSPSST